MGNHATLTATVLPANATNKEVTWESKNTTVATVNASGTVTGIAAGSVDITVTTVDGSFTKTCKVTVTEGLEVGDYYPLGATKDNAVGIVFWKNPNDATKGKIVSMDEATNKTWAEAMSWVSTKNDGGRTWTIPTKDELQYIWCAYNNVAPTTWYRDLSADAPANETAKAAFNKKLTHPFTPTFHWSSTEEETEAQGCAWVVYFTDGGTDYHSQTKYRTCARAISSF